MKKLISSALLATMAFSVACQPSGNLGPQSMQPGMRPLRAPQLAAMSQRHFMPDQVIVKFKRGTSSALEQKTLQAMGLQKIKAVANPRMGIQLVKTAPGAAIDQIVRQLKANPAVQYAEPNGIIRLPKEKVSAPRFRAMDDAPSYPNDEMFDQQYAHKVSQSQKGWAISQGSESVVLSIVDTGVDSQHPDLAGKMLPGYNIVDSNDNPRDGQGHGTHCAGIAAAMTNNGVGVAGYAPNVKILPVKVLTDDGWGTWADVAGGIAWAAEHGAHVISMSLGGSSPSEVVEEAVNLALSKDVVVLAAMGNDGDNSQSYPAAYKGVLAIGATDESDERAYFSQYGDWISVSAPGVDILSTFPTYASGMPGTNYGAISGTSMATPGAAGVAALIRSQFPAMNREQVRAQLEKGTDDLGAPGFDPYFGHGRINVLKALSTGARR